VDWLRYLVRQVAFSLLALWVVVSLTFLLRGLAGLHPLVQGSSVFVPPARGTLLQQYLGYLGNVARFDFGPSLRHDYRDSGPIPSASSTVLQALPWTLLLVIPGTLIAIVIGSVLGILLAWRRGSQLDTWITAAVIFVTSIPYYFAAIALVFTVSLHVSWFPSQLWTPTLMSSLSFPAIGDLLRHMILPVTAVILGTFGLWVLPMRNAMVAVMDDDFMTFGAAKGLRAWRLMVGYAARNAILPIATNFAIQLGYVFGGALFVEIVFEWPGAGALLYQSLRAQDYPTVQALIVLAAGATLVANLAVRAIYPLLDPRLRHG
jgi:peptide/nickel transport system permease protein